MLTPRTAQLSSKTHARDWQKLGVLYARIALGSAFLSAVASRFGLWNGTFDLKHFSTFLDYAREVLAFMPARAVPLFAWAATACETTLGILLIIGLWPRLSRPRLQFCWQCWNVHGHFSRIEIAHGLLRLFRIKRGSPSGPACLWANEPNPEWNRPKERIMIHKRSNIFFIAVLVSIALTGANLHSQTSNDDQLLHARERVWHAWFDGNSKTLADLVPAETIVMSGGEKEWKHQAEVLRSSAEFHAKGGRLIRLEFPRTEIQHFGNVAVIWSSYVLESEADGKRSTDSGRVTEIFVRRNGHWVNPGWHTDDGK